ncbi:MAG TPA: tetratricopeptide repeat protein [Wenzhouxiangellaceae bacterium]|nr:tetratricopeptide repeat protein [Wenzhouxiangellaceae bacterium]
MNDDARARRRGTAKPARCGSSRPCLPTRPMPMLFAAAVSLLAGCAGPSPREVEHDDLRSRAPALNASLFGEPVPVPEFSEMVELTPEQQADFKRFFHSGVNSRHEPHQRVYEYLTRRLGDTDFQHRTLSASTTIDTRSGNCMSLALVTTAFARLADVEIGWQLADADPVYSSEGSVIYSAEHIQTRLYRPEFSLNSHSFAFGRPYLLVDYYTDNAPSSGTALSEFEMIALVYQNLAVEALAEGRLDESFWHLRAALEYDPVNSNLYNALAVVHRRAGDARTAEALYRFALDEFGDRLIILRNYRKLLLANNRIEDADRVERRIMVLPDPDPYPLLGLGDEAADQGKPDVALAYYRRAAEVAPYLHEVYLKMAQIHTQRGDLKRAERALRKARDHAWADSDQQRYQAKLTALGEH